MSIKSLVAIPVFNEQDYVLRVLRATQVYASEILVVDDGSTDATPALLEQVAGISVIRHANNRGYGRSLADAFAFAERHAYDWLITMDCDEQHEPSSIPAFVEAMTSDVADVVSGSRYLETFAGDDLPPADRRSINQRISRLVNEHLGYSITDAFCGFKAYRVSSLSRMRITEEGYAMPMQFWVQAARLGFRVTELPIKLVYNDPTRHFGGALDDPQVRYQHYVDVFEGELRKQAPLTEARLTEACLTETPLTETRLTKASCSSRRVATLDGCSSAAHHSATKCSPL